VPDWGALVRERLPEADLPSAQRDEIIAEIAGHLEEFYEEQRTLGLSDADALNHALGQVADWREFARKIERAKREEGIMNQRTKSFWLPSLINLTAAVALLAILAQAGYQTKMILAYPKLMLVIYPLWLAGQPLLGAIGAYASRRGGGTRLARLASGLFPTIVLAVAMCAVYLASLIGGILHGRIDDGHFVLALIGKDALGVIVIPGLALLLGTLPFLRSSETKTLAGN
jgi:hypothetical protein